jgi:hypothetical protein
MKTGSLRLSLILTLAFVLTAAAAAMAVPQKITYQGLLSEDGELVTGSKSVTFRIFSTSTGGTALWEEEQSVDFENGAFGVVLGAGTPIPESLFDGTRRWLSVTVEGESEMLPRPEILSVGYAFHAGTADDAVTLDGRESWEYAGATHTHDSRYYTKSTLSTTDGDPPNQGANLLHWDLLNNVPTGFADGIDNTGGGVTDHGMLTGLADDDHPQYARKTVLKTSDATGPNEGSNQVHWDNLDGVPADFADGVDNTLPGGPIDHGELTGLEDDDHPQYAQELVLQASDTTGPNEGSNQVHWDNLGGVPAGFADGNDDITTNASLITTGSMAPERVAGTAVTQAYGGLLTEAQKDSLTGGGITELHHHQEIGDVSSVTAGQGLSGGGMQGAVSISHAADASAIPSAHHYAPVLVHKEVTDYESNYEELTVVASVTIDAPDTGVLHITFSGTQVLDIDLEGTWQPKRYIAEYGVAVDDSSGFDYFVRSSMYDVEGDAVDLVLDQYLPSNPVAGTTVRPVAAGTHTVYLMTDIVHKFDTGATNRFFSPSIAVTYYQFGTTASPLAKGASPGPPGGADESGATMKEPDYR